MLKAKLGKSIALLICLGLISSQSAASEESTFEAQALDRSKELNLSAHPTWRKLLYMNLGDQGADQKSDVTSETYFLSERGHQDAQLELITTIKAYFEHWPEEVNKHSVCRFPARYYWLSQHIDLPDLSERCARLNLWGVHKNTESISLVLVGGYLGNPASSFGHALLKINSSQPGRSDDLFSKTINFGAATPPDEPIIKYITYGVFGGYKASFSNQYFAVQDQVYTRTENRDMWEYELNLTDEQIRLLLLHIWEISGKEFDYYFFDNNCAYRIAQLAELVINNPLSKTNKPWYLPEQLFQNLSKPKLGDSNQHSKQDNLIRNIKFIPSSKRTLFRQMQLLHEDEIELLQGIIEDESNSSKNWEALNEKPIERQIIVLDTLLAYHQYLMISQNNESNSYSSNLKKHILLERLKLPAQQITKPESSSIESPEKGNREAALHASFYRNENREGGLILGVAAYRRDHISRVQMDGNELVLMDASAYLSSEDLDLERIHFLKISNLRPDPYDIGQSKQWAWQFDTGARKDRISHKTEFFFEGGFGDSLTLIENLNAYALLSLHAYSTNTHVSLGGKIGFTYLSQSFSLSTYSERSWDKDSKQRSHTFLQLNTPATQSTSLFLEASDREIWAWKAGILLYF